MTQQQLADSIALIGIHALEILLPVILLWIVAFGFARMLSWRKAETWIIALPGRVLRWGGRILLWVVRFTIGGPCLLVGHVFMWIGRTLWPLRR